MTGLYIHVPFCVKKCSYCDFYSLSGSESQFLSYTEAVIREIDLLNAAFPAPLIHTVYFGGGTPSCLPLPEIGRLCDAVKKNFALAPNAEIAIEANPGTLQAADYRELFELGFNRLSLGVQSIHKTELSLFGRIHTHEDTVHSVYRAKQAGFTNISLDLIFGAPTQTRAGFLSSLNEIINLEPTHISLYAFSLEDGTLISRQVASGVLAELGDDLVGDMYFDARKTCEQAGYRHYEISNWAISGSESRHNINYWRSGEYYGLGPAAHSFYSGRRSWHAPSLGGYIEKMRHASILDDVCCSDGFEDIDTVEAMSEMMFLGLRLLEEGVSDAVFFARFGCSFMDVFGHEIDHLLKRGLVILKNDSLYLNPKAAFISNQVFSEFVRSD